MVVLVTGGARSGKSRFAEEYAAKRGKEGIYIATSQIYDEEMQVRVERHQARRVNANFNWKTIEEPYELCGKLGIANGSIVLVDCLTLWLTNWMLRYENEPNSDAKVLAKIDELADVLTRLSGCVTIVTNEVGDGIVPEYPLGRHFRDLAGIMNQRIAAVCNQVFLVTAGIPIELKSIAYAFPEDSDPGWII